MWSDLWWLTLVWVVAVAGLVLLVLQYYANWKHTPWYAWITTFIGWWFCMAIAIVLPTDISGAAYRHCLAQQDAAAASLVLVAVNQTTSFSYSTLVDSSTSLSSSGSVVPSSLIDGGCHMPLIYVPELFTLIMWNMLYWTAFMLSWLICPLLQDYSTAGDFTFGEKVKATLRSNGWFYGFALGLLIVLVFIFILLPKKYKNGSNNPIDPLMALANGWGLLLIILTLSYGMVEFPKKWWRKGNLEMELQRYRYEATTLLNKFESAKENLNKTLKLIRRYEEKIEHEDPFWPFIELILEKCPQPQYGDIGHGEGNAELRYDKLVSLNGDLINQKHAVQVQGYLYEKLAHKAINLEDILLSKVGGEGRIKWTFRKNVENDLLASLQRLYYLYIKPVFFRVLGVLMMVMSLLIMYCECTFSFKIKGYSLSLLALLITPESIRQNDVILTAVLFIPLTYIVTCSYWAFFQLRIFNYFRMVPKYSTANSILFAASYLGRLAPPLSYNFLKMLGFEGTSFQVVMQGMENMPLVGSNSIYVYAPIGMVVLTVLVGFNFFTRVFRLLHIRRFTYDQPVTEKDISQGRMILENERARHQESAARAADGGDAETPLRVDVPDHSVTPKGPKPASVTAAAIAKSSPSSSPSSYKASKGKGVKTSSFLPDYDDDDFTSGGTRRIAPSSGGINEPDSGRRSATGSFWWGNPATTSTTPKTLL